MKKTKVVIFSAIVFSATVGVQMSMAGKHTIIGSGSGAFAAATYLASHGEEVTMIERDGVIGGTCVNYGCVPSKILIQSGKIAHSQAHSPFRGIEGLEPRVDPRALLEQRAGRVMELRGAKYEHVLSQHPLIRLIKGTAQFLDKNTVLVDKGEGSHEEFKSDNVLIATGSSPYIPNIEGLSSTPYWTSKEALYSDEIPKHLIVLGGSVIALEIAQAFSRLGSNVTLLARSTLLSKMDPDIGTQLEKIFRQASINVKTHTVPTNVSYGDGIFNIITDHETITGDRLLVALGRHANTTALNLGAVGLETTSNGSIPVDKFMRTRVENVFAVGDCTDQPQYVYVAAAAGTRAAMNMTGKQINLDLSIVPEVVFTDPQVATVGLTKAMADSMNLDAEVRLLTLDNVPRALANFETDGFIKLVAEKGTRRLLGAQIVASNAGDVIETAVFALRGRMTISELAAPLYPYLTMVEGIKLCAQTFFTDVKNLSCCSDSATYTEGDEQEEMKHLPIAAAAQHDCCAKQEERPRSRGSRFRDESSDEDPFSKL